MFAMVDLVYVGVTAFVCLRYHANFVSAWQHVVAWIHGAESYAAYLQGRGNALLTKAEAVKAAATTAASSAVTAVTTAAKS